MNSFLWFDRAVIKLKEADKMKTETLRNSSDVILRYLEEVPYSDATIHYYGCCFDNVISYCETNSVISFTHETAARFSDWQSGRAANGEIHWVYAKTIRKAAFVLADYLAYGTINWKRRNYHEHSLTNSYQALLEDFCSSIKGTLSEGSVDLIIMTVRHFLFFLVEKSCLDIANLNTCLVTEFIIREAPKHSGNRVNLTWPIKKFLRYLFSLGKISFDPNPLFMNPVPNRRKVLPSFEDEEISRMFSSIDKGTAIGKRDLAIMKLALSTGMRSTDLLGLKLSEIDWRKNEIRIIQDKTGTALTLPLMPDAGNALADYILNARPKSSEPYVFLRVRRPYTRLPASTNGANILKRCQKAAGISRTAGDGKSFHAFRRTAGTNMVRSGVELTLVSQMLGHNSLDSTRRYLSLHDEMLSECCMKMDGLLTQKEGLS